MSASAVVSPAMLRASATLYALLQKVLMIAGVVFLAGLFALQAGHTGLVDALRSYVEAADDSAQEIAHEGDAVDPSVPVEAGAAAVELSPRMQGALDYVAKRYRVSTRALEPIFVTAQATGKELRIDPLLIIAVIGVESGFNPFSQSVVGAKGLMQVMPRFHMDKLPEAADAAAFLDPVTNVRVGARVLQESIRRYGGLEGGLQQFGGALNDPERRYAAKVLAERQRLEQAAVRLRTT
jgi:soluble lytic murein transglycosylase-like protein